MRLRVMLFAVARQRAGKEEIEVDLPAAATVRHLRGALADQFPPLADILRHVRFAVNGDYATDTVSLTPESEIAIIPPVSGG